MAQYGISGAPLNISLPYAQVIQNECLAHNSLPKLVYSIATIETIAGEVHGLWPSAARVMSQNGDGGHGLFQLTSSWPARWQDPAVNTAYAITVFISPNLNMFGVRGVRGEDLVRLVAAAFNAGATRAWNAYKREKAGQVGALDAVTTDYYPTRALRVYKRLYANLPPF